MATPEPSHSIPPPQRRFAPVPPPAPPAPAPAVPAAPAASTSPVAASTSAPTLSGVAAEPGNVHELKTLVLSRHPLIVVETSEEERADGILAAVGAGVRLPLFDWTVTTGLVRAPATTGMYGTEEPPQLLATIRDMGADGLFVLKDFAPHLTTPAASRAFRDLLEAFAAPDRMATVVLVGAQVALPPEVEPHAMRFALRLPDRDEYRRTIAHVVESLALNGRARVEVAEPEFEDFAAALSGLTLNQARQAIARVAIEDGALRRDDVRRVVELKAEALRDEGLLEYFPFADNAYELGGFGNLQRWLQRARIGFSAQAAELNIAPPRGVMLVGVQGCGKSLAAKVIARQWTLPLLKLDAGRLYDKYVGESERNFRKAIDTAEAMAPVVLWIDEIEKGLAPSGSGDGDGGLSRRIFGSFLTWMQEKREEVFVVATANDLSMLPPEMLRKGRFDEIFFVDLPDEAERADIVRIHLRLRKQDPAAIDVAAVVAATAGFSGAELEQAVISSLLRALQEGRALDTELLLAEVGSTVPLSRSRREDVEKLRAFAAERFVAVR